MGPEARRGFAGCRWLLLVVLVSTACKGAAPPAAGPASTFEPRPAAESPGPPTTLRVVLQLQNDGTFRLVSADPKRGSVTPGPSVAEHREALAEGRVRLVEYTARDAKGDILATGTFLVPLVAVSEFQDPEAETRLRHAEEKLTNPTVRVSLPYQASVATIAFEALQPDAGTDPRDWKRAPMGAVKVALPAPPQGEPPPR
jgi:hypothetical protein